MENNALSTQVSLLLQLPEELLLLILSNLVPAPFRESPDDPFAYHSRWNRADYDFDKKKNRENINCLRNVTLTCRRLYNIGTELLYKRPISKGWCRSSSLCQALADPSLSRFVQAVGLDARPTRSDLIQLLSPGFNSWSLNPIPIFTAPRVRSVFLRGFDLSAMQEGYPFESPVRTLRLLHCDSELDQLRLVLAGMPNLEDLHYDVGEFQFLRESNNDVSAMLKPRSSVSDVKAPILQKARDLPCSGDKTIQIGNDQTELPEGIDPPPFMPSQLYHSFLQDILVGKEAGLIPNLSRIILCVYRPWHDNFTESERMLINSLRNVGVQVDII
ncbi:hypothetical protein VTN49DRAFT_7391 [Thermomyces lanuginosus]|uniref:uncharacterized protein n=1 Tax=Thermomyces lanuginosus TaxID=5541 RepID=UPI0037425F91